MVSPTIFQAGNAVNVIPDTAKIGVNFRTKSEEDRNFLFERIEAVARSVAAVHGAEVDIRAVRGCAATIQDPAMIERALRVAKEVMPADKVATGTGMTGSEDFSAFAEKVPSVYLILGNHHPAFRPDEGCFMAGVRIEAAMALDFLMRP